MNPRPTDALQNTDTHPMRGRMTGGESPMSANGLCTDGIPGISIADQR